MNKVTIINTGGTFNKIYNPISGTLDIDKNGKAIKQILQTINFNNYNLINIISKDSLEITKKDRIKLLNTIKTKKVIIVHGTDTIDKTAKFLDKHIKNKVVVLTASMLPFSIDPIEATSNFL